MIPRTVSSVLINPRPTQYLKNTTAGRRFNSSQPSPTGNFYKSFGRPILKVTLPAIFIYQLCYFGWARLEADELMRDRQAEIDELEAKLSKLQEPVETPKDSVKAAVKAK